MVVVVEELVLVLVAAACETLDVVVDWDEDSLLLLSKVLPMGPNLMLEKTTCELGTSASTSAGTPESVEQDPRSVPAPVAPTG